MKPAPPVIKIFSISIANSAAKIIKALVMGEQKSGIRADYCLGFDTCQLGF